MKKIMLMFASLLMLAGCGNNTSNNEVETVCKNDQPYSGYESGEQTLISKGDRVQVIKVKAIYDFQDKDALDEMEENFEETVVNLMDLEGVKFSMERIDDTRAYDMSEIDLKTADLKELNELGMIQLDNESQTTGYISLKKSISLIEELGFVCETVK